MESEKSAKSFTVPASISEFSDIKAFNIAKESVVPPVLPMVYDERIKLSQNEILVLSKGPKFAVRQKIMKENFPSRIGENDLQAEIQRS